MTIRRCIFTCAVAVVALASFLPSARATEITFALRSTGQGGGEPTLGQLPDGTILLQAYGDTLATTDEGAHWTIAHTPPTTKYGTADPMLVVDPVTGRAVASELLVASQVISVRDETTGAWTDVVDHAATGDHQQIASGPWRAGSPIPHLYPRAFYSCANYVLTTYCAVSRDGGLTWGPNVPVYAGVDPLATDGMARAVCGGIEGKPHVALGGTVYLPKEHCGRPFIAVSEDEGLTWRTHHVAGPHTQTRPIGAANDPIVTTDAAGTVYYAWTGADWAHWISVSKDQGETWSTPQKVSAPEGVRSTTFPLIIGGRPGAVATAYLGSKNVIPEGFDEEGEPLWQGPGDAHPEATWNLYVAFSFDADAEAPTWTTLQLTTDADPVWIGCIGKHATACGGAIGRQGMADFTGIALTRDGRVMIAYTDGCIGCSTAAQSEGDIAHLAIQAGGATIL